MYLQERSNTFQFVNTQNNFTEYAKISLSSIYILAWVPNFFREVAPRVLYPRLDVVVFETHSYNTQSHFTFTALDENVL